MMYKKLLLWLLGLAIFSGTMAQITDNYNTNWKNVEAAEIKGLTKTAQAEVNTIYKLAIKNNNDAQQIKACMYLIRYRNMIEENSRENNIFFVDTLVAKATAPAKNILQSMQAEMFWQYLQNNRWKLYNRTKLEAEKSNDINTWSLDKLHQTITGLYKASLQNNALLKTTPLIAFEPILVKGENTRELRPSLFDFLAHRALQYFTTDENDLRKPAYQFTLKDEKIFANAAIFIATKFTTQDTASLQLHAIRLLQDMLQFHMNDRKPDALLDADLIRLKFVYQYGVMSNKEQLYEAALRNIEEKYATNPASAQAMYLRAAVYYNKGIQHRDENSDNPHQYEIKRAKELCDITYAKFPKSEGGINAANLIQTILQPMLQMETEKVNLPYQPFRSLVKYKNAPIVYFRIIKTSNDEIKKLEKNEDNKMWQRMVGLTPVKSWQVAMADPKDFMPHAAEIKTEAIGNGTYYLLASLDNTFSLAKNSLAKQVIYVSNIASINTGNDYYLLHRETGMPLPNAKVQVWENKYNYNNSNYENKKAETYTSDNNGHFILASTKENRNITLQITTANDELHLLENNYSNNYYNNIYPQEKTKPTTWLFMDRSIYRPGQTIFFKGIVVQQQKDAGKSSVVPNLTTAIQLKDANEQTIKELKVTTNEYGSYSGSFKLPEAILNGNFSIQDTTTDGVKYFSVEEYKRPTFLVDVQKPKGTYRINDSIAVTAIVKGYAGNNIDGAAVKYRVVRTIQYPIWWGYTSYRKPGGYPFRNREEVEITNGDATTNANGEFRIHFKALPDESIDKKDQPTFNYEVSADVTDINGETRSTTTTVTVAYQALKLEIKIADKIPVDSFKNILIRSTNVNDIEEKTNVTVSIQQVKSPGKIFRERYWQQPDQFVMSKEEYYLYFPYDIYKNENEIKNYPEGDKVFERTDSSNRQWSIKDDESAMGKNKIKAGWYKIVALTKDKYGEEVKAEKYILLTGDDQATSETNEPFTFNLSKPVAEPGEKIQYDFKTSFNKIWLIQTVSKINQLPVTSFKTIQSTQPVSSFETITEQDRGGMAINYIFVKNNRVYKGDERINIPWNNKELTINYSTFRDKLLPGAKDKWTATISGNKGEKLAAEMLVAMYDASLDQFKMHGWNSINIWPEIYSAIQWNESGFGSIGTDEFNMSFGNYLATQSKTYDRLLAFKDEMQDRRYQLRIRGAATLEKSNDISGATLNVAEGDMLQGKVAGVNISKKKTLNADTIITISKTETENVPLQIRKNFSETAFFYPDLTTDAVGNVSFSFTIPEALTQWKLMTLAHTKNASSGYLEKTLVTQKPLMVQPNAPRFMREGDRMEFSAKVINLSDSELTGTATLELMDAASNKPVDGWFKNIFPNQYFTVAAGQSAAINFPVEIPFNFNSALTYRIIAKASNNAVAEDAGFSDGEEMSLPILTNRMLVTESMPINLRNTDTKNFKFEKLLKSGTSETIVNHALTVEYSSNPVWYAVQALPYLMEPRYECADQIFTRYYANTLASFVSNSNPKIKAVFEKWKITDTVALLSNLQKNEELKAALLLETPWVLNAQNEAQQKRNIALLFDEIKLGTEQGKAFAKLTEMQAPNGGFVWFKGGPDDRYITQYIITGIGHLRKLKAINAKDYEAIEPVVDKALVYLDEKIKEDYNYLVKHKIELSKNNLGFTAIQYLYMRSFFIDKEANTSIGKAFSYYINQSEKYWLQQSKYMQGMIALAHHRLFPMAKTEKKIKNTPIAIIKSLKENSINNAELGMYWKDWANGGGYYWHQAPIESQAMMIEAFTDIDGDAGTIADLKTWLLKQKQTQNWKTTKATAEACYALLLSNPKGENSANSLLNTEKEVSIKLGTVTINSNEPSGNKNTPSGDGGTAAGTGYFKNRIDGKDLKPEMGNIEVTLQSADTKSPPLGGWGAIYWQYFEDLDKITSSSTPLKLTKKLFVEKKSDKGPVLQGIEDGAVLKVGDKVKVRIELRVDRDMEYVHMKDMRAACMEPVNVLSGYKYQGGLGYYESTKDASTSFFFSWLNKGTYVFEYPVFVTHTGNFSNGITSIQCMYAPEFTSNSEGIRVEVE